MHSLEAYLAAADVGGGTDWLSRAVDIARFFVDVQARQNAWRIPEHYTASWEPDLAYNRDLVDDPFRPYGATPGHGLEWARLLLELESRLKGNPLPWLLDGARALFDRAVTDGLSPTTPGLPYTTGWDGEVVMASRFHWVMAEAVQAADALWLRTGDTPYLNLRDRWWDEIDRWFIAGDNGLWHHELDEHLRVAGRTWPDAPDAYHAYNALTTSTAPTF
jgi:mannose/cellobiose epimerase-like protein (N-acyl-D-glucosamine 2-epimerase family)